MKLKLLSDLEGIVQQVESAVGVDLDDDNFAYGRDEIIHVFLHEACHAAVSRCVPWIDELDDSEHTALDEILARLLETEIANLVGVDAHSSAEHAQELSMYGIAITTELFTRLQEEWQRSYWPTRDILGMASFAREELRSATAR